MLVLNDSLTPRGGIAALAGTIDPAASYAMASRFRPVPAQDCLPVGDVSDRRRISAHPVLGRLPEQDHQALLQRSRVHSVKRKDVVCRQGDPVGSVILVLHGYMKISTPVVDGDDVVLEIAGPGECIGDLAALQGLAHDADVTAFTPCRLLMIDMRQFRQVLGRRPESLLALIGLASQRLRRTTAQLVDSHALTAPARLAKTLLYLSSLPRNGPGSPGCPPLRLSQGELGAISGVCREVVNMQLGIWRDAGWITLSGGAVTSICTRSILRLLQDQA